MRLSSSLLLASLLLAGCDGSKSTDSGSTGPGGDGGGGEDTGPPPTQDWCGVQAIFDAKCTVCHDASSPAGELDLETDGWSAIVDVESALYAEQILVAPGAPDDSFLLAKVENTHDVASQGDAMPPTSGLTSEYSAVIRTWIEDGATSECDETDGGAGDGGADRYHPDGYDDPTAHGMQAKLAEQVCADCHGADLTGEGDALSCDGCHVSDDPGGWRSDCTFCHGGVEAGTHGAPPESIRDELVDTAFGVHTSHVTASNHAPYDCVACHVKPTDVLSSGHLWDGTAGQAETDFAAGLSPLGSWSATSLGCSNLYCHSDGQDGHEATGSVAVADAPLACDSCHAGPDSREDDWERMSGNHKKHLEEGIGCSDCHMDTVNRDGSLDDVSLHVNGIKDIVLEHSDEISYNPTAGTCSGDCHGEDHRSEDWFHD